MHRMPILFLAPLVVGLSVGSLVSAPLSAAESPYAEDLQFIQDLRTRGYSDLAREYLEKLAKNAPAALKKELDFEIALTNMEAANDEPDSNKRLTLYAQARASFQAFLQNNPGHPRAAEVRLDIARATTLQGKTQLSRALLEEDKKSRIAEGLKARAMLVDAYNQLKQLPPTPQTELAMGLNLLDQAQTYLNEDNLQESINRGKPVEEARKILEKLASGDASQKITWQVGDEDVAEMDWRILKFKPKDEEASAATAAVPDDLDADAMMRPAHSRDTKFFWEGVNAHELRIQKRADGSLQHPPVPALWQDKEAPIDYVVASGKGTVFSFVVNHYPQVAAFDYPLAVGLIELEEGTRLVADIVGIAAEDISIGLPVEVEFVEAEPASTLAERIAAKVDERVAGVESRGVVR